jgi:myo-inositol-1(or 4)-monophosphatase
MIVAMNLVQGSTSHSPIYSLPEGALEFARTITHQTGQFLKATFGRLTASTKHDGTLVTESDIESDRRLTEAILARYPSHGVLSEEHDRTYRGQEWCWVIDPIDGTTNFTWGFPMWGVLVGLLHYGQPVLGVADFPLSSEQYWAALGQGAWRNSEDSDERIATADVQQLASSQLFATCTRAFKLGRPNIIPKIRVAGSAGFDLATVARGSCVGTLQMTVHVWDVAALWPILQEAGGVTHTNTSSPVFPLQPNRDYRDVIFSVLAASSQPILESLHAQLSDRFY